MDNLNLNSFLKMGYFLDYTNKHYDFDLKSVNKRKFSEATEEELIKIGVDLTNEIFSSRYNSDKKNCVPLSGGLDSRAILAGLLKCTEARNIDTFTFGMPGTLDYEIGCHVAKKLGTKHISFPFTEHKFSTEELIETSNCIDNQTVLFSTFPLYKLRENYSNCYIWSGAFAGVPTGNVLKGEPSQTKTQAKINFINHGYSLVKSTKLTNCEDKDFFSLLEIDFVNKHSITYDEQLHLKIAQLKWIAPHLLMKGFNNIAPFIDEKWVSFMLSVDNVLRKNQRLYRKVLLEAYPKAFTYPTKSYYHGCRLKDGKARILLHRGYNKVKRTLLQNRKNYVNASVNYIDFDTGIRERPDLHDVIRNNIFDLKQRKLVTWIDIDKLWSNHICNFENHSDALRALASLEIHLKAKEQYN